MLIHVFLYSRVTLLLLICYLVGGGDMENLRQVVDAGEVKRLSNESGGGGLVVEPLAVVVDATGGQAGVEDVENLLTILSLRRCHHTFGSANRFSLSQILKPINSLLYINN